MPPHMQIDANDMQMGQSKPGFANVLCQAASYEVQPGLVCARSSHLGPTDLGVNVQLHLLQEAFPRPPSSLGLGAASRERALRWGGTFTPSNHDSRGQSPLNPRNWHQAWHQRGPEGLQAE